MTGWDSDPRLNSWLFGAIAGLITAIAVLIFG